MTASNVTLSYGDVSFSAEGDETWLSTQLDKVLSMATSPTRVSSAGKGEAKSVAPSGGAIGSEPFTTTLASHIKAKGGEVNQVKRFLATADWLRLRGVITLNTAAVTKALSDGHQKRLGNPADCLNKNVTKGFCEKTGDDFFVTPEGLNALGYP